MLLFICCRLIRAVINSSFNTSHVVIYQEVTEKERGNKLFQYISCCYLSNTCKDGMLLELSFNTSHVVIYQST